MSPRLDVRAVERYLAPDYPGRSIDPAGVVRGRYGENVLDRMRRGLARPLVVFGLFASLSLPAAGDDERPGIRAAEDPEPRDDSPVRMLSREEIAGLVGDLARMELDTALQVKGYIAGIAGVLTEEEGRAVLEAMFRKNGLDVARNVRVRGAGLDLEVDGFDAGRGVGFEYLDPTRTPGGPDDLAPAGLAEIEIERARRERAILVVDGRNYAFNVSGMGHLPAKAEAVDRLLEDVRRFLIWLEEER